MRFLKTIFAVAGIALSLAAFVPEASARGFHSHIGHRHWSHHSHWSFHRHWGFHRHWHTRYSYRYHYHYRYRYGYRTHYRLGYRPVGYAVAVAPRACPPGTHLGYMGRFCHPNRY